MSIEKLQAENARLKTEVEHLMVFCNYTLIPNKELQAEVQRLKATVEKVILTADKIDEQNQRLRKAGDAMAERLMYQGYPETVPAWNAAKEGKPSA